MEAVRVDIEHLSAAEKEQLKREYEQRQDKRYADGQRIIFWIATINIAGSVLLFFFRFNFISMIIQICLSIALYRGVSWVRYLFAIGAALSVFATLGIIFGEDFGVGIAGWLMLLLFVELVYHVASAVILFTNRSVSEFLYEQKNG